MPTVADQLNKVVEKTERLIELCSALQEENDLLKLENQSLSTALKVSTGKTEELEQKLKDFCVHLVLTAHPTQFYPGSVLGIMTDLIEALKINDINSIDGLLQQLGKTPFFNKTSPTPVDEAVSLVWFLENIFYHAVTGIQSKLEEEFERL